MMERKVERRGLGRGLSALMADVNLDGAATTAAGLDTQVPIEKIVPNPDQPRRNFAADSLQELADSIRQKGVIQPLIVRRIDASDQFQIVAGERRWRAAQIAQLHRLPVIVRDFSDAEVLEIAIIENVQRAELNAIEEAEAYRQLMQRFGHTQEKIAEALSRSRSHIANLLRLLTLPEGIQDMVRRGVITAGHARALIGAENPEAFARRIVAEGLSVRAAEEMVRKQPVTKRQQRHSGAGHEKDADTRALEQDLSASLGMMVRIDHGQAGDGGRISVSYRTLDQLDRLCQALSVVSRDLSEPWE